MVSLESAIELLCPPVLKVGRGAVSGVGAYAESCKYQRILVIADVFNAARMDVLGLKGEVNVYSKVTAEPELSDLADAIAAASAFRPDFVVGFGGGSAMDLAKLVAVLWTGEQNIRDVVGPNKVAPRKTALAQVATTAGTGSEAGMRALVTDLETANKLSVQSRELLADLAVVDPDLMMTVPARVTAETGVDALAHCAEAYTNVHAHPLIDLYALQGIRLVGKYLPRAVKDGSDAEARTGMAVASLYGGFCLGPVNTHAGHAVAYPLGTHYHMPHGAANAVIFPHVLAFNAPVVPERTADILAALGLEPTSDPARALAESHKWCADLGIEMSLAKRGVVQSDLKPMAEEAALNRRLLDNNPQDVTATDILKIYDDAW